MVDSGAVDGSDLSFLGEGTASKAGASRRGPETGFKNTLLTGGSGVGKKGDEGDEIKDGEVAGPSTTEPVVFSQEL